MNVTGEFSPIGVLRGPTLVGAWPGTFGRVSTRRHGTTGTNTVSSAVPAPDTTIEPVTATAVNAPAAPKPNQRQPDNDITPRPFGYSNRPGASHKNALILTIATLKQQGIASQNPTQATVHISRSGTSVGASAIVY